MTQQELNVVLRAYLGWRRHSGVGENPLRLAGACLDNLDMGSWGLQGVDFRGASLRGAHLDRASLEHTCFVNADLTGARLSHAALRFTDFTCAVLRNAQLDFADAEDARFDGACLDGADFRGTRFTCLNCGLPERGGNHVGFKCVSAPGHFKPFEGYAP